MVKPPTVRMDLIYEGITTVQPVTNASGGAYGQNGPDLRRDYDGPPVSRLLQGLASEWT